MSRQDEINAVINMIDDLCMEAQISLVSYEIPKGKLKGLNIIAIKDCITGKIYAIQKQREEK